MKIPADASVPCGTCTSCCRGNTAVFLFPEHGDRPDDLKTQVGWNPLTGKPGLRLQTKDNGDCAHLGPAGCEVYEHRPRVCRNFSCLALAQWPAARRRKMIELDGPGAKALFDRGYQLLKETRK